MPLLIYLLVTWFGTLLAVFGLYVLRARRPRRHHPRPPLRTVEVWEEAA